MYSILWQVRPPSPGPSPSGGEGSFSGEKVGGYGSDHLGGIVFHVFGGKPHDPIAAGFEESLALGVSLLLAFVNRAVDLHDEAMAGAEEIDHEGANGLLPSEGDAESVATQYGPEPPLTGCGRLAKVPRHLHHPPMETYWNSNPLSCHHHSLSK